MNQMEVGCLLKKINDPETAIHDTVGPEPIVVNGVTRAPFLMAENK